MGEGRDIAIVANSSFWTTAAKQFLMKHYTLHLYHFRQTF